MIARVRGEVLELDGSAVATVDVGGVGYEVQLPNPAPISLRVGDTVLLWIRTLARDEIPALYGFWNAEEREWFDRLRRIQGVGPQVAMSILGSLSVRSLLDAVAASDVARLQAVSGVGPRLATRLSTELKRFVDEATLVDAPKPKASRALKDITEALKSLGFAPAEVAKVIAVLPPEIDVETGLKDALRMMSR